MPAGHDLAAANAELRKSIDANTEIAKLLLALRTEISDHAEKIRGELKHEGEASKESSHRFREEVARITGHAAQRIAMQADDALKPQRRNTAGRWHPWSLRSRARASRHGLGRSHRWRRLP